MTAIRLAVLVVLATSSLAVADKTFNGGKGGTWDCKSDPVVAITSTSGSYTIRGDCKSVNVTGGHNTLTIESVGALDIAGASNTVTIDAVDTVNVNGAANKITWKKGKSVDKPQVSQFGQNNSITQAH
jgi:hypothetical protein